MEDIAIVQNATRILSPGSLFSEPLWLRIYTSLGNVALEQSFHVFVDVQQYSTQKLYKG